jgi:predicted transcriptional regulator
VPQLAALMHKSESAIHRAIRILRDSGLLERVGPDRGGRWKVIE